MLKRRCVPAWKRGFLLVLTFSIVGYNNYDYSYEHDTDLQVNTYTEIQIQQSKSVESGKFTFKVSIGGKMVHEVVNDEPQAFKNVRMYVSSPWYRPADVLVKDLKLETPFFEFGQQGKYSKFQFPSVRFSGNMIGSAKKFGKTAYNILRSIVSATNFHTNDFDFCWRTIFPNRNFPRFLRESLLYFSRSFFLRWKMGRS